jgi:hypothetical protein
MHTATKSQAALSALASSLTPHPDGTPLRPVRPLAADRPTRLRMLISPRLRRSSASKS